MRLRNTGYRIQVTRLSIFSDFTTTFITGSTVLVRAILGGGCAKGGVQQGVYKRGCTRGGVQEGVYKRGCTGQYDGTVVLKSPVIHVMTSGECGLLTC